MTEVVQTYEAAVVSGLLPGASLVAGDLTGKVCPISSHLDIQDCQSIPFPIAKGQSLTAIER